MQSTHTKVKNIKYEQFKMQSYLCSNRLSQGEIQTLTAFRSQCTRGISMNFRKMYKNLECPLKCSVLNHPDNQNHILQCNKLNPLGQKVQYTQICGTQDEQEQVAKVLQKLVRKQNQILEITEDNTFS